MRKFYQFALLLLITLVIAGCAGYRFGYRNFSGPVEPQPESRQQEGAQVLDDGTVVQTLGRLEIGLRPMTDDELNRQFPEASTGGLNSTNPYTYGDWRPSGQDWTPSRFTVFRLKVKNYEFPKMEVDPLKAELISSDGRHYEPFSFLELENYFYRYATGYAGNKYEDFDARTDILRQNTYRKGVIFSGQEPSIGYVVFPPLHSDVTDFTITLKDIVLEFDYRNEPVRTTDLTFHFQREIYQARQPMTSR